jgi:glycosyltransferase involved in cell wall biosynthesis
MDSNHVLIDARVTGIDGIFRYTHNLVRALVALLPCLGINALELLLRSNELQQYSSSCQFDTSEHYTHAELQCLANAAKQTTASLLHCTDYRVPLHPLKMPLVVSIHDIFRYTNPALCYSDTEFKDRYGTARFGDVCLIVDELETKLEPKREGSRGKSDTVDPYHHRYYQLLLKWAVQRADIVLVPSRWVRVEIEKTFGSTGNIEVIPYGINHQIDGSDTRDGLSLKKLTLGYPYFVYVGQDRPHKNVGKLLEAFALLCQRDSQIKLVLVGKDFEQNQQVTSTVKRAGLQSSVILLGKVNDEELRRIYKQACALVHLAMFEGFGFTPLEALSYGTPVIVADTPIMRETVGEFAMFVNPNDVENVADTLFTIMRSSRFHTEAERRVAITHASKYTWEATALRTLQAWTTAIHHFQTKQ